jgi:hypothetical protein
MKDYTAVVYMRGTPGAVGLIILDHFKALRLQLTVRRVELDERYRPGLTETSYDGIDCRRSG